MIFMWLKLIKSTPNPSAQLNQTMKNGLGLMANFLLMQSQTCWGLLRPWINLPGKFLLIQNLLKLTLYYRWIVGLVPGDSIKWVVLQKVGCFGANPKFNLTCCSCTKATSIILNNLQLSQTSIFSDIWWNGIRDIIIPQYSAKDGHLVILKSHIRRFRAKKK